MNSDIKTTISKMLHESDTPKIHEGLTCALCSKTGLQLSLHVLEKSIDEGTLYPHGFVPMSASRCRLRGSFTLCTLCAPACKKCDLPITTDKVLEYGHRHDIKIGLGICQHLQWSVFFIALFKKLLKRGRFATHVS